MEAAARLHRHVRIDMTALHPHCPDYEALLDLSEAVNRTIRALTGEDPEWMRVSCHADMAVEGPVLDDVLTARTGEDARAARQARGG